MEMGLAALVAAIGGAAVIVGMVGHLLVSTFSDEVRSRHASEHVLEVFVNGKVTTINLSRLDTEDPAKIDKTIEAVRASRRIEHA